MKTHFVLAALPLTTTAFLSTQPVFTPATNTLTTRSAGRVYMYQPGGLTYDNKLAAREVNEAGISAPFGFFDPLGFYKNKTVRQKKKLREAEIKHSRVAMLAFLGIVVQENFHPFLVGSDIGPAISHFDQVLEVAPDFWTVLLITLSLAEVTVITRGWDPIEESKGKIAGLRDDFVAGNLSYDPFSLCPDNDDGFLKMRTKELNNGRLAMIAVALIVLQEKVTGHALFNGLFGGS